MVPKGLFISYAARRFHTVCIKAEKEVVMILKAEVIIHVPNLGCFKVKISTCLCLKVRPIKALDYLVLNAKMPSGEYSPN